MERSPKQLRSRLRRATVYSCVRSMRRARFIEPRTAPRCEIHAGKRPRWQRRPAVDRTFPEYVTAAVRTVVQRPAHRVKIWSLSAIDAVPCSTSSLQVECAEFIFVKARTHSAVRRQADGVPVWRVRVRTAGCVRCDVLLRSHNRCATVVIAAVDRVFLR